MKLTQLKTFFLSPSMNKMNSWIEASVELPQRPGYLIQALRMLAAANNGESINKVKLIEEITKNNRLVTKLMNLVKENEQHEAINPAEIQELICNLEYPLIEHELEIDIAKKYYHPFTMTQSPGLVQNYRQAMKAALSASTIIKWAKTSGSEVAFFATLLQDLSKTVIVFRDPDSAKRIQELSQHGASETEAELTAIGFDHCQLNAKLFKHYQMPEAMIDLAINDYNHIKVKDSHKSLALTVEFANFIAKGFQDKNESPSKMWAKAQPYLNQLQISFSQENWADAISVLFVKCLEFEMAVIGS